MQENLEGEPPYGRSLIDTTPKAKPPIHKLCIGGLFLCGYG
jgi:hypothetical protein